MSFGSFRLKDRPRIKTMDCLSLGAASLIWLLVSSAVAYRLTTAVAARV